MKVTPAFVLLGGFNALLAMAQTLDPSPTESVGCVPHDDHWHCEGPRPTSSIISSLPAAVTTSSTHDVEDEHDYTIASESASLRPSPTASVGCEPHGDHWHCDGPAMTPISSTTTTSGAAAGTGISMPTSSRAITPITAGAAIDKVSGITGILGLLAVAMVGL